MIDIRGEQANAFRTALQPVADAQIAALKADGKDVDGLVAAVKAKIAEL